MPKRSPRRRRSRSARSAGAGLRARLRPWLWLVAGAVLAFGLVSFLLLDLRVRAQFGQAQWRLPAHVYTQPLEVYEGRRLALAELIRHLDGAGYRRVEAADRPGRFAVNGHTLSVHTRAFEYPEDVEASRRLTIRFAGDRIAALETATGEAAIVRLEPERMGSIYPGRQEDRILVRLGDAPPLLVAGLIAVEDRDFFEHHGVQASAIGRALVANIRAGRTVQGGSTLTQQLVKNFFLSNERTLGRKFTEALMALSLEWHYSKEQILEAYLNEVYLGQDGERAIHGFGLGARFWFNRPLAELELHELALLIGLVKGPSHYDPRRHPERARARRDVVLRALARSPGVGEARARAAMARPLGVVERDAVRLSAYPAYIDLVRRQLARDYHERDLRSGGLRVFTHLDPRVQAAAEDAIGERLQRLGPAGGDGLQAAAVVADSDSGAVRAVVGDRRPRRAGYNRALDARRSIGSLVKPAVYLAALRRPGRYTLVSPLEDAPLTLDLGGGRAWSPRNYDGEFHGTVPLIDALVHSYNAASARLGLDLGLARVDATLEALGVARGRALVPADLLGALSLTPLEVTAMYQTLAAGGFDAPLNAIAAVHGGDGGSPARRYGLEVRQAVEPAPVFLLDTALHQVAQRGTARALRSLLPGRAVAGKTGTTDDLRDSWFAGFDGRRTAVVWVGRDDNRSGHLSGSAGALRVWADMMRRIPAVPRRTTAPAGIEWARVDPEAGRSLPPHCAGAPRLPFIQGSVPRRASRCGAGR